MHEFDSKDLKRLFGLPASQVRSLIKAGHIKPLLIAGRLNYSFQDLIVLRTLGSLRAAKIPTQKINRTLRAIRESLPGELPLSGLSIVAVGDRIVVREGQSLRESDTGQYTLALEFIEGKIQKNRIDLKRIQSLLEILQQVEPVKHRLLFFCRQSHLHVEAFLHIALLHPQQLRL